MSDSHNKKIAFLLEAVRKCRDDINSQHPLALSYGNTPSNTTRTKTYKEHCTPFHFENFNEIIAIDPQRNIAIVEPRITMRDLLEATLPYGLAPPVLPEFKGITVGGAIMGGAAESGSHRYGCFNDICQAYEIVTGKGELLRISPTENEDLFYGMASSYGSLATIVSAEIELIPITNEIHLTIHPCPSSEIIQRLQSFYHKPDAPLFLEGLIFSENVAAIIEANPCKSSAHLSPPHFSLKNPSAPWFYQHVKEIASHKNGKIFEEKMPIRDYFFRYDLGAFWMGALLFQSPFFSRFTMEGVLGFNPQNSQHFSAKELQRLTPLRDPSFIQRTLFRPILDATKLWRLLHRAEGWCRDRLFIQDFCIPEGSALEFCQTIIQNPSIYPIWLCPIQGTHTKQIFSPHLLKDNCSASHLINFGLYGIPPLSPSISEITKHLEKEVAKQGGRKVLYSHSYYTEEDFWKIYSKDCYEKIREKTGAKGIWKEITQKVLL